MRQLLLTLLMLTITSHSEAADYNWSPKKNFKYASMEKRSKPINHMSFNSIESVNSFVNQSVSYESDGEDDYWQSPKETMDRRKGDCEDFAILKKQILLDNGHREADLVIMVGSIGKEYHAVLRVATSAGYKYLDNRYSQPLIRNPLIPEKFYGINNLQWRVVL